MTTTYIPPTVKQFVDGAMVAFFDASATNAIEQAFESSTQTATSAVSNQTIANLGMAFSTSPVVTGNIAADLNAAAVNLTGSAITVPGEANAFITGVYDVALASGFTSAQAEGITIAAFVASTLGAQAGNLGLSPSDLTAFQIQQQTAINRAAVSGFYADATVSNPALIPAAVGDAAWVASQNALLGITNDPATVAAEEAQITAANNNPALITGQAVVFNLTPGVDTFTTSAKGAVFNALPAAGTLGLTNTLNTGDTLTDTKGDGTLNVTDVFATAGLLANPPFATGVTMSGISTLNISNQARAIIFGAIKAGFQGNVTGLTTVNDNASLGAVQLGNTGQGLNTALTAVNINQFAGTPTALAAAPVFAAYIAQSASSAANALTVNLNGNLGTLGTAGAILIANDGGPGTAGPGNANTSYGTETYNLGKSNTATYLQLESNGVDGATKFVFTGPGTLAVGQDSAGDHQNVTTIDASGTTGTVVITGETAGAATGNAYASTANPGWLFGSGAGFLDDTGTGGVFDLTSFKLGSGTNILDVSSATAAQIAALTTTPGTLVALNNEIILNDGVATTASATTFANIKGFEILGIGGTAAADGSGGTINVANLPASISEIDYVTAAGGALTITNQADPLTVNTFDNGGGFAITSTGTGLNDSFTLDIGNVLHSAAGSVGNLTLTADSLVTINAAGQTSTGPSITDTLGYVSLTPALIGNEQVTITGTTDLKIGVGGVGGIADVNSAGALITNNMIITDTDTGVVTLASSSGGTAALDTPSPGDTATGSFGNPLTNSTNAVSIDATKSGGLIMTGGDANYTTSLTVAGSIGDTFLGSKSAGDVFGGSIGNDTFTLQQGSAPETIFTGGGADTVNLVAGHTGGDVIGFYAGFDTPGVTPGGFEIPRHASITDAGDVPQLGWWGQATGGTATGYAAAGADYAGLIGNGTGTTADASIINNFVPGVDTLAFAASSGAGYGPVWNKGGPNGLGGTALGLVDGAMASFTGGVDATVQTVAAGGTVNAATNFIELSGVFNNIGTVATELENGTYTLNFSGALGVDDSAHMLIAWQDLSGMTHVSDMAIENPFGAGITSTFAANIHLSDIAELPNTTVTALVGIGAAHPNVHFA